MAAVQSITTSFCAMCSYSRARHSGFYKEIVLNVSHMSPCHHDRSLTSDSPRRLPIQTMNICSPVLVGVIVVALGAGHSGALGRDRSFVCLP